MKGGIGLIAIKKLFLSPLILLLFVAFIVRKPNNLASIQIEKIATYDLDRKKINLISNKSFRYFNLYSHWLSFATFVHRIYFIVIIVFFYDLIVTFENIYSCFEDFW